METAEASRFMRMHDEDLARIAFSDERDGFEQSVVRAAKNEMERRSIPTEQIEVLKSETEDHQDNESAKETMPLGLIGRTLFLIFSFSFFAWFATFVLDSRGYKQKFRDSWRWIFYGFMFWILTGLTLNLVLMNL